MESLYQILEEAYAALASFNWRFCHLHHMHPTPDSGSHEKLVLA